MLSYQPLKKVPIRKVYGLESSVLMLYHEVVVIMGNGDFDCREYDLAVLFRARGLSHLPLKVGKKVTVNV